MADNKQYVTQIQKNGALHISEDVIGAIVAHALCEVEGVAGLNTKPGSDIVEMIGKRSKGVKVSVAEDAELTVDCNITVSYGQSIVDIAKAAQAAVSNALSAVAGIDAAIVNINVCGISRQ